MGFAPLDTLMLWRWLIESELIREPVRLPAGAFHTTIAARMAEQHIFENVSELNAGARGAPGNRTFYLLAGTRDAWVRVWLEKTQLLALGETIDQVLAQQARGDLRPEWESADPNQLLTNGEPMSSPAAEFQVGRLGVAHDPQRDLIVVVVQEASAGRPVTLQFWCTKLQMSALTKRIGEVVAGGRPVCPLCGQPLEDGHVCPRSNGHHHVTA
jgi:uncharacterized repeat protein (TIGR03847 family)